MIIAISKKNTDAKIKKLWSYSTINKERMRCVRIFAKTSFYTRITKHSVVFVLRLVLKKKKKRHSNFDHNETSDCIAINFKPIGKLSNQRVLTCIQLYWFRQHNPFNVIKSEFREKRQTILISENLSKNSRYLTFSGTLCVRLICFVFKFNSSQRERIIFWYK